jgi:hypothetical protein
MLPYLRLHTLLQGTHTRVRVRMRKCREIFRVCRARRVFSGGQNLAELRNSQERAMLSEVDVGMVPAALVGQHWCSPNSLFVAGRDDLKSILKFSIVVALWTDPNMTNDQCRTDAVRLSSLNLFRSHQLHRHEDATAASPRPKHSLHLCNSLRKSSF